MINPFVQKLIGTVVRSALMALSGWLLANHPLPEDQAAQVTTLVNTVVDSLPAVLALAWSAREKYVAQRKIVTALAMPTGSTEAMVEKEIRAGGAPPVTLAKDESPYLKAKE